MKKSLSTPNDEVQDLNYKQIAKVKYLNEQFQELMSLKQDLTTISLKSKQLLMSISQDRNRKTTEEQVSKLLDQLRQNMQETRDRLQTKKNMLEKQIVQAERGKKEDQLLYRKILTNYQEKIGELKEIVLNRQTYIQELEKGRRENKNIAIEKKMILPNASNMQTLHQYIEELSKLKKQADENVRLKEQANKYLVDLQKLENMLVKLQMARQTNMPFFKFKDIVRNGIEKISHADKDQYQFLLEEVGKINQKSGIDFNVSNEKLYLLLRKEAMNVKLLKDMIESETKKQQELQQYNIKLKQALKIREEQKQCLEVSGRLHQELNWKRISRWDSMSSKANSRKKVQAEQKKEMPRCTKTECKSLLQFMAKNLKAVISQLFFLKNTKVSKRSKSEQPRVPLEDESTWKHQDPKQSFYDKCDDFITDRFYQDIDDVQC